MGINVIRPEWIRDSSLVNEWLSHQRYELALFEGLKIGVTGFNKKDFDEIVGII